MEKLPESHKQIAAEAQHANTSIRIETFEIKILIKAVATSKGTNESHRIIFTIHESDQP
jgi:hypothetical protein